LEIWQVRQAEIDLLVTDVVMPDGINGHQLANLLRAQTPELKVVFMSGHSPNVVDGKADFLKSRNSYFLQKPFAAQALMRSVRGCLDGIEKRV